MNTRERFHDVCNFNPAVRTLKWEFGYWGETIKRWYAQGLPQRHYPPLPAKITTPASSLYIPAWTHAGDGVLPNGIAVFGGAAYWPTQGFPLDTDGDCSGLIPLFLEAGVTGMWPFEHSGGTDVSRIRERYPGLVISGGIAKSAIAGGRQSIDKALEPVDEMLARGGYIPHVDHFVPPEVTLDAFSYYRRRLNQLIDARGHRGATAPVRWDVDHRRGPRSGQHPGRPQTSDLPRKRPG